MGTIVTRQGKHGTSYRAQLRIKKDGALVYNGSRTFSEEKLAKLWLKRTEAAIELDDAMLLTHKKQKTTAKPTMTLHDAIARYSAEVTDYARTKKFSLAALLKYDIVDKDITTLTRKDFTAHANQRRDGYPDISKATLAQDFIYIRGVITYANDAWGFDTDIAILELQRATKAMTTARIIGKGLKRTRLPTTDELMQLHNHFVALWARQKQTVPMHLIMWLAITTCRRQGEIPRLTHSDLNLTDKYIWVRDIKNPTGSRGNSKQAQLTDQAIAVITAILDNDVQQRMTGGQYSEFILPVNPKMISKYWRDGCKMLGIHDLRFHDLRHEGATRLAEARYTIPEMQRVTLHDSWSSLERYVNMTTRSNVLTYQDCTNKNPMR